MLAWLPLYQAGIHERTTAILAGPSDLNGSWNPNKDVEPGWFVTGLHTVAYTAKDESNNRATCSFNVMVSEDRPICNEPHTPDNSALTCFMGKDKVTQASFQIKFIVFRC